jgi:hypothetical protein
VKIAKAYLKSPPADSGSAARDSDSLPEKVKLLRRSLASPNAAVEQNIKLV